MLAFQQARRPDEEDEVEADHSRRPPEGLRRWPLASKDDAEIEQKAVECQHVRHMAAGIAVEAQVRYGMNLVAIGTRTLDESVERDIQIVGAEAANGGGDGRANLSRQRQRHDNGDGDDTSGLRPIGVAGEIDDAYKRGLMELLYPPLKSHVASERARATRRDGEDGQRHQADEPQRGEEHRVACTPRPAAPIVSAARRAYLMRVRRPRQRRRWRWLMRWCPHGVVILFPPPASLVIPAG